MIAHLSATGFEVKCASDSQFLTVNLWVTECMRVKHNRHPMRSFVKLVTHTNTKYPPDDDDGGHGISSWIFHFTFFF